MLHSINLNVHCMKSCVFYLLPASQIKSHFDFALSNVNVINGVNQTYLL